MCECKPYTDGLVSAGRKKKGWGVGNLPRAGEMPLMASELWVDRYSCSLWHVCFEGKRDYAQEVNYAQEETWGIKPDCMSEGGGSHIMLV